MKKVDCIRRESGELSLLMGNHGRSTAKLLFQSIVRSKDGADSWGPFCGTSWISNSQPGALLSLRRHLAISRDMFIVVTGEGGGATGI